MNLIVAMDPTGIIGLEGRMPWHYPEDLGRFKAKTAGGILLMGRKTWESLPGKLPGRDHLILSRDPEFGPGLPKGVWVVRSFSEAIAKAQEIIPGALLWLCGGGEIYKQALEQKLVKHIDITFVPPVENLPEGANPTMFPDKQLNKWTNASSLRNKNDPRLSHLILEV